MSSTDSRSPELATPENLDAVVSRIARGYTKRTSPITIGAAVVAAYLVALVLQIRESDLDLRFYAVLVAILAPFALVIPRVLIKSMLRRTLAFNPEDRPGDRLTRILTHPRRSDLASGASNWVGGGTLFTLAIVLLYGKPWIAVPLGTLVAFSHWLMTGILTTLALQDLLQAEANAELHRHPGILPKGRGLLWPRKSWFLPYTFAVLFGTVLIDIGVLMAMKFRSITEASVERLRLAGDASVAEGVDIVAQEIGQSITGPVLTIVIPLGALFLYAAIQLASRESRAAMAIADSLRALAAEDPKLPQWMSTDETGDIAVHTAAISHEMRGVFEKLRAVAKGDLSVSLDGNSQLVTAFRESQLALIRATDQLVQTGQVVEHAGMGGEMGRAFGQLSRALEGIVRQAGTIAQGDLRADEPLDGALGTAIHRMTHNLRQMVGRTQDMGANVADIVVTLRSAATQLSAATAQQVAALTETANTMTEMAQTSAVSAERAAELIQRGDEARRAMENGRARAKEAGDAMLAIRDALARTSTESSALAEKVQRVDDIIDTVGFLADQSSTLAINAGIEAARAGESGRAFASVAREMRALAAESRKATQQIRDILGDVRSGTQQVDRTIGAGGATVERGTGLVQQLGGTVEELWVTIQDAVGLMRQVEGAARQHEAGVGQVSQALTSMQSASESIRDGARTLSEMSEQAHGLAEDLKGTAAAYQLPARG